VPVLEPPQPRWLGVGVGGGGGDARTTRGAGGGALEPRGHTRDVEGVTTPSARRLPLVDDVIADGALHFRHKGVVVEGAWERQDTFFRQTQFYSYIPRALSSFARLQLSQKVGR